MSDSIRSWGKQDALPLELGEVVEVLEIVVVVVVQQAEHRGERDERRHDHRVISRKVCSLPW